LLRRSLDLSGSAAGCLLAERGQKWPFQVHKPARNLPALARLAHGAAFATQAQQPPETLPRQDTVRFRGDIALSISSDRSQPCRQKAAPLVLTSLDTTAFWLQLSTMATGLALWAQRRAHPQLDPVAALTYRLRHPVESAVRHPLAAVKRSLARRR
jgi:hypothetical protein